MTQKVIITIARQFGSGGRYIGKKLAELFEIPFYDKALIQLAAENSGIDPDLFENADEAPSSVFWNTSAGINLFGNRLSNFTDMPMNDKLFLIQSDIIRKLAQENSCVIVGRCADYILRDMENTVHVFIHSDFQDKINRMVQYYGVQEKNAKETMQKTDRKRASYYNYYTGGKWGLAENYDLSVKTSAVTTDGAVQMIQEFAKMKLHI
ncbi:AAA family ATPase [Sinanaerobacter chloroacetimidivorans]|uniref:Cytidylate kinase-like family protein n=1 Tax=Sinanaerobacter chloroacetimidivorans TaxID=2818044 RepID=A0A8J7VWI3_9FIRM|nr:cytidylate kinase-like family protein [Sinanaerobacter chloroacetimidivorans]MBR0596327.1 cytidylate kinase-like family protein [Sinanaerobacter chloroacetimidivorans]